MLKSLFDQASPRNRLLVFALSVVAGLEALANLPVFAGWYKGVDIEIPLRAAERWISGGQPYLASAFSLTEGPDLPFLYPPLLLPFLVPLTWLPRAVVIAAWLTLIVVAGAWVLRRLSLPWRLVPLVMLWPPFMEGLVGGNVQMLQLAAFVALFYGSCAAGELRPANPEKPESPGLRRDVVDGLLAAGTGALKYTQLLPLLWLLRPRPRAAVIGGVAIAALALATLPLSGISIYFDWVAQLGRATDPNWADAGGPLSFLIGRPLGLVAAGIAVLAMFFVRGRDTGAWVGIALIVVAPSVHGFGLLFLLPALVTLRRDLGLFIAILLATYKLEFWWLGIALAGIALLATRWAPGLRYRISPAVPEALGADGSPLPRLREASR